ncbi:MAG: serine--tRNA ligase [Mycoplasmatales bacterium]
MIDIKKIVEDKDYVIKHLNMRGTDYSSKIEEALSTYNEYTELVKNNEDIQAEVNTKSKLIGKYKQQGKNVESLLGEISSLKDSLQDDKVKFLREKFQGILHEIPNMLQEDTPIGDDDEDNVEVRLVGEKPSFNFEVKEHFEIGEDLGEMDFERAVKLAKSRFILNRGSIAKLERVLMQFMLDEQVKKGYIEHNVPFVANEDTLFASGQLPKFDEDLFELSKNAKEDDEFENDRRFFLIPTSEVVLANLHRDEIIDYNSLPLKYTAFSACFRKEAGGAGRDTKGMIRVHQFGKVELFKYTRPEDSNQELEGMVNDAEDILKKLNIHYRVIRLCSGDVGMGASKTYDIEAWFPAQEKYREISSCSNVTDYQARRAKIRMKDNDGNTIHPHMLNGSGLPTGRLVAAIIENYQNADGTFDVPEVLKKYYI